jgi:hypothetical protein
LASKSFLVEQRRRTRFKQAFAEMKKMAHKQALINVLYRRQYILGADFPKDATLARPIRY